MPRIIRHFGLFSLGSRKLLDSMDSTGDMSNKPKKQASTLGHVRLRDSATNEIILVPTPSSDPKDPLNWFALSPSRLTDRLPN